MDGKIKFMTTTANRGFEEKFGTKGAWHPARVDKTAVENSFRKHVQIHRHSKENTINPSVDDVNFALLRIEDILSYLKFTISDDWDSYEAFLRSLNEVDMTSVPGAELKKYGSTNGQVLGWNGVTYDPQRLQIVWAHVKARLKDLETEEVAGPIQVFIKHEEHKTSKVKEGRFRLISSVSLVDTIVDRMLFPGLYDRVVTQALKGSPIAIGWSPFYNGAQYITSRIKKPKAVDMSSWDWTVQQWMVRAAYYILRALCVNAGPRWEAIFEHRWGALFKAVFLLPSGTTLRQKFYGIMKSGSFFHSHS